MSQTKKIIHIIAVIWIVFTTGYMVNDYFIVPRARNAQVQPNTADIDCREKIIADLKTAECRQFPIIGEDEIVQVINASCLDSKQKPE